MKKPQVVDEEFIFNGGKIVSETDLKGIITYANRQFCDISGYTLQELLQKPHNIIRHPDMPKAAFEQMWADIKAGKDWHGYVKNLRKDGRYYWVDTHITPIYDENRRIKGYIAARGVPERKNIEQVIEQYNKLLAAE
jgi:aerotaxis receptor